MSLLLTTYAKQRITDKLLNGLPWYTGALTLQLLGTTVSQPTEHVIESGTTNYTYNGVAENAENADQMDWLNSDGEDWTITTYRIVDVAVNVIAEEVLETAITVADSSTHSLLVGDVVISFGE